MQRKFAPSEISKFLCPIEKSTGKRNVYLLSSHFSRAQDVHRKVANDLSALNHVTERRKKLKRKFLFRHLILETKSKYTNFQISMRPTFKGHPPRYLRFWTLVLPPTYP